MVRAEKTGLVLAEILCNRVQGERPVSLVGYGLGARVIYACLTSLSEKRAFGIVENVVLFGAPCPSELRVWAAMKSVVAGRLVNVYSKKDYLLGFLYRTCAWNYGIAGLQPIEGVPRVENVDLSDSIRNHLHYPYHIGSVLLRLRWEDANYEEIQKDIPKRNLAMSEELSLDEVEVQTPEPTERNGNVKKDRKPDARHKGRAAGKQAGKGEAKAKPAPKQPGNNKAKQGGQGEQESHKPRHNKNRVENKRPS